VQLFKSLRAKKSIINKRRFTMKLTKKHVNSVIILAASSLIWSPYGAQAVEFSLAGQVNRLIMNVDNGEEDGIVHADNSVSGTRWSIQGSGDLDNDMMVGFLYETQLQSNPSNQVEASELDWTATVSMAMSAPATSFRPGIPISGSRATSARSPWDRAVALPMAPPKSINPAPR
jgi:hypothetical protein